MLRKLITCLVLLGTTNLHSQNLLREAVSVNLQNQTIAESLAAISASSEVRFSYNPDQLPDRQVTANYEDTPVQTVLLDLLGTSYECKVRGSYIILTPTQKKTTKKTGQIQGEVVDATTGERIAGVSVYEVDRLSAATLTSQDGSYQLSPKTGGDPMLIAVSSEHYKDTVIVVHRSRDEFVKLLLEPIKKQQRKLISDTTWIKDFWVNQRLKRHQRNINLSAHRIFQMSLVPGIGTNGFLTGKFTHNLSLNIIGGFTQGIKGVELGGVFNITERMLQGAQVAGAFNATGQSSTGLQLAGAVNRTKNSFTGWQVAGAVNHTDTLKGGQISGASNFAKVASGLQLSGAFNFLTGTMYGAQMTGCFNYGHHIYGFQLSGAYNHADTLYGVQFSTINRTLRLHGVQVGIINIAEKVENGTMIGIINIARDEVLTFELSSNDVTRYNLSFKSGAKHFYTILSTGIHDQYELWGAGGGFGTDISLKPFHLSVDLTAHTLFKLHEKTPHPALNPRLGLTLGLTVFENISIYGGPVVHYLYQRNTDTFPAVYELGKNTTFSHEVNNILHKWWAGYTFGIRL